MKKVQEVRRLTLLSVYDEDLRRLQLRIGKDRSVRTWKAMLQGRGYVASFLKEHSHADDISLKKLTPQFIYDFSSYLSADRGLRGGTVWLACQQLKGVVTRAHQRGQIHWNPFVGFHIAKNIRPREYLTEEELTTLMHHRFAKPALDYARDIFLFAAFTGMAFVDIKELRPSDIVSINGACWIVSRRHKTHIPYQVKLLEIPQQILKRYGRYRMSDTVFESLEYRTLAKRIHRIMDECGFRKRITMHCARHTFAILALNKGMPIESVSRILGHTNITTTQIYAKITMSKLEEDMDQFSRRLNLSSSCFVSPM